MSEEAPLSYSEALRWLYGLQVHGIKLGLENMERLCDALGVDVRSSEKRKFIHVAGTNGKGSVCAMVAAICCAAGLRTGLYTSPHLVSFRERIRLGANLIPEVHVAELIAEIQRATADWSHAPTFFEVTTALALLWFQRQRAEWIILETGLGGRLDATNVVTPAVSVITAIGLDHMQYLGPTLHAIAGEKAGIIKPGVPVISAPQESEAEAVLRTAAQVRGCSIHFPTTPVAADWRMALAGSHQRMNAAIAFAALVAAGLRPDMRQVSQALSQVDWPGRFQRVRDGAIVLDGAHNPQAARRLVETWREEYPGEKATLVLGVLEDKDVRGICEALLPIAQWVICVPVRSPRGMDPRKLADVFRGIASVPCLAMDSLMAGMTQAQKHSERTLVAGSLFLVGEALAQLGLLSGAQEWSAQ